MNYEAQKVEFNHSGESLGGAEKVVGSCPELNYFNTPCLYLVPWLPGPSLSEIIHHGLRRPTPLGHRLACRSGHYVRGRTFSGYPIRS